MPDAIWIDRDEDLRALAQELAAQPWIGVDTEFLRERTFFPKLCLLQIAAADRVWCVDALSGSLESLIPVLTAAITSKVIHAARQDLEAFYCGSKRIISPVFDTQIAAGCIGLKPQIGYADLANLAAGVRLSKGQTRTDWSKRPLSPEQLEYAADDVLHLGAIMRFLDTRLRELGREEWVAEDCRALEDAGLYEPDPGQAWERLRGLAQLEPRPRSRAKAAAVWRERVARAHNLPRAWILSEPAIFEIAQANPGSVKALRSLRNVPPSFNESFAVDLLEALHEEARADVTDAEPGQELRPTPAQKTLIAKLNEIVDAKAGSLGVSAEILCPRGELKSLAMGRRDVPALGGWRRKEIGDALLEALGQVE